MAEITINKLLPLSSNSTFQPYVTTSKYEMWVQSFTPAVLKGSFYAIHRSVLFSITVYNEPPNCAIHILNLLHCYEYFD
jgi:hypothetical protein